MGGYRTTGLSAQERYVRLRENVAIVQYTNTLKKAHGGKLPDFVSAEQIEDVAFAKLYSVQLAMTYDECDYLTWLTMTTLGVVNTEKKPPEVPVSFRGLALGPPLCLTKK